MLSVRIVPCLDVRDGRVVKGVRFRDHVDMGEIVELACRYRDAGADELQPSAVERRLGQRPEDGAGGVLRVPAEPQDERHAAAAELRVLAALGVHVEALDSLAQLLAVDAEE